LLYKKLESSVVQILAQASDFELTGNIEKGSGFVYDKLGHIITNHHVVNDSRAVFVTFTDGKSYTANIIGKDPYTDMAVLQLDKSAVDKENLSPLPLGNSSSMEVGQEVFAIGNPLGLSGSMTHGIISQLDRPMVEAELAFAMPGFIQIDVPINPGNSGGPLFDLDGKIIGMTTGGMGETNTGLNFALPSNTIKKIAQILISGRSYKHPYAGISATDIDPILAQQLGLADAEGVMVSNTTSDTPAASAGLLTGDVITQIDNFKIRKVEDMLNYLETKSVGDTVAVKVLRFNNPKIINITLAERPLPSDIDLMHPP
jgi:S1-C subfamily serine protease